MKVWLVQRAEPTPHDNCGDQRAMRTGIIAQMLVREGHQVVWWTSTFDHYNRLHRHKNDVRLTVNQDYQIQYLRGCGYKKNMSVSRIRDNVLVARRFADLAEKDPAPADIILASFPAAELAHAAVKYGRKHDIPVILDVRDLWPDVFFDLSPPLLRPAVCFISMPMKRRLKKAAAGASGIIGLTDAFVDWGVKHAGRRRSDADRVFPMGYLAEDMPKSGIEDGMEFWRKKGITKDKNVIKAVFFGSLGKTNDLYPVIEAAELLGKRYAPVQIIICGAGEKYDEIKKKVSGVKNVCLPGWITGCQIKTLLQMADIGIAPYIDCENYTRNIPNKPAEYLSGGLAVALSLDKGVLYDLLIQRGCGFTYHNRAQTLAAELQSVAGSPERLIRLQTNALETFSEVFDGNAVYTRLVRFLEDVASGQPGMFPK